MKLTGKQIEEIKRKITCRDEWLTYPTGYTLHCDLIDTIESQQNEIVKMNRAIDNASEFLGKERGCPPDSHSRDCNKQESCQQCWKNWILGCDANE